MSTKKYAFGLFVSFLDAFDNMEWVRVVCKLREIGCEEIGLWKSYFSKRRVCMNGVNEIVWRNADVRKSPSVVYSFKTL